MATVHHRRVVIVPTPTWYRERRGSHNRNCVACVAKNTQYSPAAYLAAPLSRAVSLRPRDPATSFPARFAKPRVDYSEVSHPQPKIDYCLPAELIATPSVKRSRIPARSCWSQPAEGWECFLLREATRKKCQSLLRKQKQDPLFPLESRFYYFSDSLEKLNAN